MRRKFRSYIFGSYCFGWKRVKVNKMWVADFFFADRKRKVNYENWIHLEKTTKKTERRWTLIRSHKNDIKVDVVILSRGAKCVKDNEGSFFLATRKKNILKVVTLNPIREFSEKKLFLIKYVLILGTFWELWRKFKVSKKKLLLTTIFISLLSFISWVYPGFLEGGYYFSFF